MRDFSTPRLKILPSTKPVPVPMPIQRKLSARDVPDQKREIQRIVKRLKQVITPFYEVAGRLNTTLETEDLSAVLDALEAEAKRSSPEPHLATDDDNKAYLRRAIFDECLLEPSSVLFHTTLGPDHVRYEAMPTDFWLSCLAQLREELKNAKEKP